MLPLAFQPRPGETALSVDWLEFFQAPSHRDQLKSVLKAQERRLTISDNAFLSVFQLGVLDAYQQLQSLPLSVEPDFLVNCEAHFSHYLINDKWAAHALPVSQFLAKAVNDDRSFHFARDLRA